MSKKEWEKQVHEADSMVEAIEGTDDRVYLAAAGEGKKSQ